MHKKHILLSFLVCTVLLFSACALPDSETSEWGPHTSLLNRDSDGTEQMLGQLLSAVETRDIATMQEMFSQNTAAENPDLEEQISEFLDFFDGTEVSCKFWGSATSESRDSGVSIKETHASYDIVTTAGEYRLAMMFYTNDNASPENVGMYSIYIAKAEGTDPEMAFWGDRNWTPGIVIL